jgi:hypothetical protein
MPFLVAWFAERHAIVHIVSGIQFFNPWDDVVGVQVFR